MTKLTAPMTKLLTAISAAEAGFLFLSEADGKAVVDAGLAVVDMENTEGDKAAVSLTAEGAEAIGVELPVADEAETSGFAIEDNIPMPSTTRKGRTGGYPFATLEIGQSFHVAKTADVPNPLSRLQSSVSGARASFATDTGKTEKATRNVYERVEGSKAFAKGEDGKRIVTGTEEYDKPITEVTRDFKAAAVDASDPKGEGARVWRVALDG